MLRRQLRGPDTGERTPGRGRVQQLDGGQIIALLQNAPQERRRLPVPAQAAALAALEAACADQYGLFTERIFPCGLDYSEPVVKG